MEFNNVFYWPFLHSINPHFVCQIGMYYTKVYILNYSSSELVYKIGFLLKLWMKDFWN